MQLFTKGHPRKGSRTKLLSTRNAFQRLWQGVPPGKVPQHDNYEQEMPSRGSGQRSPQQRLQNKIIINKKCLPEALARGSAKERLQNKNYQQEMPSRGSGKKSHQERLQNNIIINKKYLPEALTRGPPRKGSRTNKLSTRNAFQRL